MGRADAGARLRRRRAPRSWRRHRRGRAARVPERRRMHGQCVELPRRRRALRLRPVPHRLRGSRHRGCSLRHLRRLLRRRPLPHRVDRLYRRLLHSRVRRDHRLPRRRRLLELHRPASAALVLSTLRARCGLPRRVPLHSGGRGAGLRAVRAHALRMTRRETALLALPTGFALTSSLATVPTKPASLCVDGPRAKAGIAFALSRRSRAKSEQIDCPRPAPPALASPVPPPFSCDPAIQELTTTCDLRTSIVHALVAFAPPLVPPFFSSDSSRPPLETRNAPATACRRSAC